MSSSLVTNLFPKNCPCRDCKWLRDREKGSLRQGFSSEGPQLGREKLINLKKFGGTPPLLDRNHPVEMSHLSRGNVPFVQSPKKPYKIAAYNFLGSLKGGGSGVFPFFAR